VGRPAILPRHPAMTSHTDVVSAWTAHAALVLWTVVGRGLYALWW